LLCPSTPNKLWVQKNTSTTPTKEGGRKRIVCACVFFSRPSSITEMAGCRFSEEILSQKIR